jgi:hypothetical protein
VLRDELTISSGPTSQPFMLLAPSLSCMVDEKATMQSNTTDRKEVLSTWSRDERPMQRVQSQRRMSLKKPTHRMGADRSSTFFHYSIVVTILCSSPNIGLAEIGEHLGHDRTLPVAYSCTRRVTSAERMSEDMSGGS